MKKVFVTLSDPVYTAAEIKAADMGLSISKYIAYLTSLAVDMPRQPQSYQHIVNTINNYVNSLSSGDTFICSSPFAPEEWTSFDISAKRTAASVLVKYLKTNKIRKIAPKTKAHVASTYQKI